MNENNEFDPGLPNIQQLIHKTAAADDMLSEIETTRSLVRLQDLDEALSGEPTQLDMVYCSQMMDGPDQWKLPLTMAVANAFAVQSYALVCDGQIRTALAGPSQLVACALMAYRAAEQHIVDHDDDLLALFRVTGARGTITHSGPTYGQIIANTISNIAVADPMIPWVPSVEIDRYVRSINPDLIPASKLILPP